MVEHTVCRKLAQHRQLLLLGRNVWGTATVRGLHGMHVVCAVIIINHL